MKDKLDKFLKILKIELQDLEEDIKSIEEYSQKMREERKITSYVFKGNVVLLHQELSGVSRLLDFVDTILPQQFSSLRKLMEHTDELLKTKSREGEFPEAVYGLVSRRVKKVFHYLEVCD